MSRVETDYDRKLKIKKKHQAAFRRFLKGKSTPYPVREYIGLNLWELKELMEDRMTKGMTWQNYGTYWVVDHTAPFWIFDMEDEKDLKLLWHPDNLMPMALKHNNHKQGALHWSILRFRKKKIYSHTVEVLIERLQKEIAVLDVYLTEY
jgi:hypothetical protein